MKLKKLYNFLDIYTFVNSAEVELAVLQYMDEYLGIHDPSYADCIEVSELAGNYIQDKGLEFDE